MRKTNYFLIVVVVLSAIAVFCITLYNAVYVSKGDESASQVVTAATSSIPLRLEIPALSIGAKVQQVGITKNGEVGIPSNFTDVAWYKYGPAPGTPGNAIVDGHLDDAISLPGVFKHLDTIAVGDDIYVVNTAGQRLHFKVTRKESIDYNADVATTADIFARNSTPNLVLITCGGIWNQSLKKYSKRFVVFSTLVT